MFLRKCTGAVIRRVYRPLPAELPPVTTCAHHSQYHSIPPWSAQPRAGCMHQHCYRLHSICRGNTLRDYWSHPRLLVVTGGNRYMSTESYGSSQELLEAVRRELENKEVNSEVQGRQLQLLTSLMGDVSEPSKQLLAKLNCGPKLTAEEVYTLAVAVFQIRNQVDESVEMATPLFEYAGELGDTNALYTFAHLLKQGQGCSPDAPRAGEIFTDLSMKGHPYAQFALAGMYYSGIGVEQNFNRAYSLYSISAKNYVPQAYNVLGTMYQNGQGVEENMEEAVAHYTKGADLGDPWAHLSLATCYQHGKGVKLSYEKAFHHHLQASEAGHPVATYNVGGHYFSGKGVGLSFKKAAEYFQKASNLGFAPAQVNLGNMYYNGLGVAKDKSKAKELYSLAAQSDNNAKLLLEELEMEEQKEREGDGQSRDGQSGDGPSGDRDKDGTST